MTAGRTRLRAIAKSAASIALALLFTLAAAAHFAYADAFAAIVPPFIPYPHTVVLLTGAIELALAAALLPRRTRPLAGKLLAAYCLAVLPANIHMALTPELRLGIPEWLLWVRVALQFPLIALILWATQPRLARRP